MGWRDAPIVGPPPAAGGWRDAPVIGDASPDDIMAMLEARDTPPLPLSPGMTPEVARAVEAMRQPPERVPLGEDLLKGLQLGTQAVGRGLADIVGAPVDILELVLNADAGLMEGVANMLPGVGDINLPRYENSFGGSNSIANMAASATEALLGDGAVIDPEDMSGRDRILYEANRFATGGAIGSTLANRAARIADNLAPRVQSALRRFIAPQLAEGSARRVLVGDTAAGFGSGAALGAYNEAVPEDDRGVIGSLLSMLAGGVGGATLARGGDAVGAAIRSNSNPLPPGVERPVDPVTLIPLSNRRLRNAASVIQESVTDLPAARQSLDEYLRGKTIDGAFGPGPDPTTGIITNDPGLLSMERRMRAQDPAPFIQSDRAIATDASRRVSGLRPDGADPQAPVDTAGRIAQERTGAARARVEDASVAAETAAEERARLAAGVQTGRSQDEASRALDRTIVDETYIPARTEKNRLYNEAAADPNVVVRTDATRAAAEAARERNAGLNPALRDPRSENIAGAFAYPQKSQAADDVAATLPSVDGPDVPVVRPLADVARDRGRLSQIEQEARAQGNFDQADTARSIRGGINEDVRTAAESGVPGTEKLAAADANYRERFAPYFRDGNVSPNFFRDIDRDPRRGATPPEATASRFLTAGPNSRAAAEDLSQILRIAPNRAEGVAAATDYAIADAVGKGIIRDGEISETALASWMSQREGMLSQLPEMRERFDTLLADVRAGNAKSNELAAELENAMASSKLTERQINNGAIGLIMDAEPRKAVQAVLADRNAPARMREAVDEFRNNPEALEGWKAAVTDALVRRVRNVSEAGVSEGVDALSANKLVNTFEDNRAALAELYTPEEMQILNQVQTRLRMSTRRSTQASSGSATAETMVDNVSKAVGLITTVWRGVLLGGSYERRTRMLLNMLPNADEATVAIADRMAFDPKIADLILNMPTDGAQVYTWTRRINQALSLAGASSNTAEDEE